MAAVGEQAAESIERLGMGMEAEDVEESEGGAEVGGVGGEVSDGGGAGMAEEEEEVVLGAREVEGGVRGGA